LQQNLAIPNPLDNSHVIKQQTKLNVHNETHKAATQKSAATSQAQATIQVPAATQVPNKMFLQPTNAARNISPAMSETPPLLMYKTPGPATNEKVPFSTTPEVIQNPNARPAMPLLKPVIKTPAVSQPRSQPNKKINIPDAVTSIVENWEMDMKKELRRRPSGQYESSNKKFFFFFNYNYLVQIQTFLIHF
jgi:hypothetical protein